MTAPTGPMDPERLDSTFGHLRGEDPAQDSPFCMWTDTAVRELLAVCDHWEAEADKWYSSWLHANEERKIAQEREDALRAQVECLKVERDGAAERAKIVFAAKNEWMERAKKAEADVRRYRSRCPVEASDVEAAGVTWEKAHAWAASEGFQPCDEDLDGAAGDGLSRFRRPGEGCGLVFERFDFDPARFPQSVAYSCNSASRRLGRPAFDILDEMASMPGASDEGADK